MLRSYSTLYGLVSGIAKQSYSHHMMRSGLLWGGGGGGGGCIIHENRLFFNAFYEHLVYPHESNFVTASRL